MEHDPDTLVLLALGPFAINATIAYTWAVMALLAIGSWVVTRRLSSEQHPSRWQSLLEVLVSGLSKQIAEASREEPGRYLPFVGTLFLFVAVSNTLAVVPGFHAPTGSLSTTAALALCVFIAVPLYGIRYHGLRGYLRHYLSPSPLMLPFHVMGELSRTLALAVRLFGNVMSEAMIGAILLAVAPLFVPVLMHVLGLLTGLVQAYVFAVLAMLYIASASQVQSARHPTPGAMEGD